MGLNTRFDDFYNLLHRSSLSWPRLPSELAAPHLMCDLLVFSSLAQLRVHNLPSQMPVPLHHTNEGTIDTEFDVQSSRRIKRQYKR